MMAAGRYRHRVRLERRVPGTATAYGNVLPATFTEIATVWAAFRPEFGREQIEAGRMESTLRGVLTVRRSADTAAVLGDARVVFTAGAYAGMTAQIRSIVPTPDNREIEMTIEQGVAT